MVTNEAKIKALKHARVRIESGKSGCLCAALPRGGAGDTLRREIKWALSPCVFVDQWVRHKTGEVPDDMRQYRLDWIDHWIDHLESTC